MARADVDKGKREGISSDENAELVRLRRENRAQAMEIEILKRASAYFLATRLKRYECARPTVTSTKTLARWGEVFSDDTVAAATILRLVHHAEVIALKGGTPTG